MGRRFLPIRILTLFLPAFLGLAACGQVSPVITRATGYMGPTGQGSVGLATTADEKCTAIWNWFEKIRTEYPYTDARHLQRRDMGEAANLFRKDEFVPVFGFAYEKENAPEIQNINQKIMPFCYGTQKGAAPAITAKFQSFFPRGIPFNRSLESMALSRMVIAQGRENLMAKLPSVPSTVQGFARLESDYLAWGKERAKDLWPTEKEEFLKAVHVRRAAVAQAVLTGLIPDPDSLPQTLANARKIHETQRYITAITESGDEAQKNFARKYSDKENNIVSALVSEMVGELDTIPLTEEGFAKSITWITSFDHKFLTWLTSVRDVPNARFAFVEKRDALFRAHQDEIYERFSSTGYGQLAVQKEEALFAQTFPLGIDTDTSFYREFINQHRKQKESAVLELLEKGAITAKEYYETVSGWAKDFIHGSP